MQKKMEKVMFDNKTGVRSKKRNSGISEEVL